MKFIYLIAFLSITLPSNGATYYINYDTGSNANTGTSTNAPWKYAPGMTGMTHGYVAASGDQLLFASGVMWPSNAFPMTLRSGISSNSPLVYGIYGGTNRAIFDGNQNWPASPFFCQQTSSSWSNAVFSSIRIQNLGPTNGPATLATAMKFYSPLNITISNCVFTPFASHAIVATHYNTSQDGNLKILNNDFTEFANGIEFGALAGTYVFSGLTIKSNTFHDLCLWGGDHGDTIHVFGSGGTAPAWWLDQTEISHNRMYGDYSGDDSVTLTYNTGQIYLETIVSNMKIFNNQFGCDNRSAVNNTTYLFSPGIITLLGGTNIGIYNNTFAMFSPTNAAVVPKSAICVSKNVNTQQSAQSLYVTNNIFSGGAWAYLFLYTNATPGTHFLSDYNIFDAQTQYAVSYANNNYSFSGFTNLYPMLEQHSYASSPIYRNSSVAPFDLRLATNSSVGIGDGASLSDLFTDDISGENQGAEWNRGAFSANSPGFFGDVIDVDVPDAPTAVSAAGFNGFVFLQWTISEGTYRIYRSTDGLEYEEVGSSSGSFFTDAQVSNSVTYFYKIKAENSFGTSVFSAVATATPTGPPVPSTSSFPPFSRRR